jgi:hypothetical protein
VGLNPMMVTSSMLVHLWTQQVHQGLPEYAGGSETGVHRAFSVVRLSGRE